MRFEGIEDVRDRPASPGTPAAGVVRRFFKNGKPFYKNSAGVEVELADAATVVPLLEHQTSLGSPSIVAGSVVMDVTSKWGISGGSVYFDDGGATAGEEAILLFDSTGALSWLPANEVHA